MSTYLLMRILESAPRRYDRGIRLLTLGRLERVYDRLASYVQNGQRVLDIGCGTGALALRAARRGAQVKGIDRNPEMLEIARKRAREAGLEEQIEWAEMGVAELGEEEPESCDAVLSGLCFSELSDDELRYTLEQVNRLLVPGGLLLVVDEGRPAGRLRRLSQRLFRAPLVAVTYLLTQQTTHPVSELPERVKRAGLVPVAIRTGTLGSLIELVARKPTASGLGEPGDAGGHRTVKRLGPVCVEVVGTLLRVLPFPCRTGLQRIGNPGRDAPVLLTGNFRLTVERVRRALHGLDAYLLVANSRGLNVWCAATGGHLTNHDVISVLKTSGIERRVDHRRVILPQLSATGIQGKQILRKTGWRVEWGPVYAADLPAYLGGGQRKTAAMRKVRFPWPQRLEMAVAWAFPISLVFALLVAPWWRAGILPIVGLVWGLALVIFLGFPLYATRLRTSGQSAGFVFFEVGEHGGPLLIWLLFVTGLLASQLAGGEFSWGTTLRWGLISFVAVLTLSLDLAGSTPVFKSGLHSDRRLRIALDVDRCRGAAFCERVCPVEVFRVDEARHLATLPGADRCVQCGACVVQCPFDALRFEGPGGEVVTPEIVRTFKLNLLGSRTVRL